PEAVGLDCDPDALGWAAENARLNGLRDRFRLVLGGPESLPGTWPLVVANLLAAPLIDMAPVLVQRVAHRGRLVVSGIPTGVAADVAQVYRRLGMRPIETPSRAGWSAVVLDASW
ncbi:MAG: 50S ribosomal protein L11 methyltransferase, partial [Vicinamibacterales bacterium]